MWNNFDNSMQQDGGGFMNDSVTQTPGKDKGDLKRSQSIVPLLIGHLNNTLDTDLNLWGTPINMFTVIAIVKKVEQATTKVTYELEDETGSISAVQWLDADKPMDDIKLNTYVRCYGVLRESNSMKHIMVVKLKQITELAEVLSHLLEVTSVCLQAQKSTAKVLNNDSAMMATAMSNCNDTISGMTKEQSIIFNIIKNDQTECGIDRTGIKQQVPPHIVKKVDDILDFLSNEGHIYTTSTDDNFKTT